MASRLYWAEGFDVPCYNIVHFPRSILELGPRAYGKNALGERAPLSWEAIDSALGRAIRLPDGRYRSVASLYLSGRPLGPWRYHGTRDGDRNDIIPREDRRELRASRLLAAWTIEQAMIAKPAQRVRAAEPDELGERNGASAR